ncbi:aminodeoxychorismate synthase component I [Oleiagrimonas sp. C23AA]|uniref:aminodeoxychorismate synthase component I n=1 Tax=Oleiagrimonas sp. C23AA TaxID=2719047 RepID=UPI001422B5E0|nr:aminodeoxychorismate synthase component I [Oleiagrimonas sp. C23AA]NII10321.1 aminodeoxychorismate synthase component I [Oleiagrimonas sp. C23AA]
MTVHCRVLDGRRDLLAAAAAYPQRYPCLLESVAHGTAPSRWDVLLALPQHARVVRSPDDGDFLGTLEAGWRAEPMSGALTDAEKTLPFLGGWALYLGYETIGQIEPALRLPAARDGLPMAVALRCPAAVLFDHDTCCTWLVAEAGYEALLDRMAEDLAQAPTPSVVLPAIEQVDEDAPQRYLDAVARVHDYLRSGDTFQANISRRWSAHYAQAPEPAALYAALRQANPAPFAALWQYDGRAVVSSSPERLVEVRDDCVQTRPIAGTRARTADDDDAARMRELVGHPKERAEHVMLIDLERNDLGRVCVPGSVEVNELMIVESYAHVHHIVSNVRGRLAPGMSPIDAIRATFPGGTITGCPKVRCMQIIAELEGEGRGAYTGALGYLDRRGHMDLNILIRTLAVNGREVSWRAGAGIVVDSDADKELAETRHKARGLLRALGLDG